jgi:transportin-1
MFRCNGPLHKYVPTSSQLPIFHVHITIDLQKLNQFTRAPDYIAYLAYILSAMPQEEDRIRTIAGYLLKNNSRLILTASPEVVEYVKTSVLRAFNDPSVMIRNAAGQDIVAFLGALEPRNWPECLEQLVNMLESTDSDRQEVSWI